jgi:hypothetical protein
MRKALFVLVLAACVPLLTFAAGSDFQLGVSALYPFPLQKVDTDEGIQASYISPGLETRLRFLHVLQVGGNATLLAPFAEKSEGTSFMASLDGGLCLDLFLVRLGAGIGPTFLFGNGEGDTASLWNFKLSAELQLGKVSLGATALYLFDSSDELADAFQSIGDWIDDPYLSATLLFKL